MENNSMHADRTRPRILRFIIALLVVATSTQVSQAQEPPACRLSDLNIDANIPDGYVRIPTKCPKVAYKRIFSPTHALGFYVVRTPYPYRISDKKTPSETVSDYVVVVEAMFDRTYKGQKYRIRRIDDSADYPPSLIDQRGACGEIEASTPISYHSRVGVQWRRGIMCLVEVPPKGSDKWVMIQAFFFDMNLGLTDYKPTAAFKQAARRLFHSIHFNGGQ